MSKVFARALESATDQTNVEPDWNGIMECIDLIRGKEISTKDAANLIVKRLNNSNPHVVHHALLLLESCMKNCGSDFHREILSSRFLEELKEIITHSPPNSEVTKKLLEMIQIWYGAFGNKAQFTAIKDVHTILQVSGYSFPAAKESDYMFAAQCAPDWVDGTACFRCRAEFGLFKRKHHCRACGQIFCDSCSSRQMYLPQFGIEKNVRVCDVCYDKNASNKQILKPNTDVKSEDETEKRRQKEIADKFEEDLQLALALSRSECEAPRRYDYQTVPASSEPHKIDVYRYLDEPDAHSDDSVYRGAAAPSISSITSEPDRMSDIAVDSALAKYLDRNYWENKRIEEERTEIAVQNQGRSSPTNGFDYVKNESMTPSVTSMQNDFANMKTSTYDSDVAETKLFCEDIHEIADTIDNRMRSNILRNRLIIDDNALGAMFVELTETHGSILQRMNHLEAERAYYEQLQDQLGSIQDARRAIDTLRQEHERARQERLAAEQMYRQAQMQHALAMMRWEKKNMINFQREKALERFQEQERTMLAERYAAAQAAQGNYPAQNFHNPMHGQYPQQQVDMIQQQQMYNPMLNANQFMNPGAVPQGHYPVQNFHNQIHGQYPQQQVDMQQQMYNPMLNVNQFMNPGAAPPVSQGHNPVQK